MVFLAYIACFVFRFWPAFLVGLIVGSAQAAGLHGDQAGCGPDEQEAVLVEAFRIAGAGLRAVDIDAAAGDPCRGLLHAAQDAGNGSRIVEAERLALKRVKQFDEQRLARNLSAGFEVQRRCWSREITREFSVVNIDADADDGISDIPGFGFRFDEDSTDFAGTDEQVVGPAEVY